MRYKKWNKQNRARAKLQHKREQAEHPCGVKLPHGSLDDETTVTLRIHFSEASKWLRCVLKNRFMALKELHVMCSSNRVGRKYRRTVSALTKAAFLANFESCIAENIRWYEDDDNVCPPQITFTWL